MPSAPTAGFETTLHRIRLEVGKRKGGPESDAPPVAELPPSSPNEEKKTALSKALRNLDRAQAKQEKARRWPRPLRGLRRDQDVINQALIDAAGAVAGEMEQLQRMVFTLMNQQVTALLQQHTHTRQIEALEHQVAALEEALSGRESGVLSPGEAEAFYTALTDRFRGSRELIKERLPEYFPFLEPLRKRFPGIEAADLGCGRGEWLELLQAQGFRARGVDSNAGMVEQCRALGLEVTEGDALTWLRSQADASLELVSGFHLVEHLPLSVLLCLFQECARVLRPGGVAIFETPNPECLRVASYTFYFDPTHRNPIPHELLEFIGTHAGFSSVHIERFHFNPEKGVFQGYGDYAGIFTK